MKRNPKRIIRLEIRGTGDPIADSLGRDLRSLRDTKVRSGPKQEKGIAMGVSFGGLLTWEVFLLVVTVAANFATIANLLYQVLRDKRSKVNSIVFRCHKKKLEISGAFSKQEIKIILEKFTEIAGDDKQIQLLDEARRRDLEKELSTLLEVLPKYKELTKPEGWKKSKEASTKLKHYKTRKTEIEKRISELEKLLSSN